MAMKENETEVPKVFSLSAGFPKTLKVKKV